MDRHHQWHQLRHSWPSRLHQHHVCGQQHHHRWHFLRGIYKSTNNGQNWSFVSDSFFICQEVIKTNSGKLVAVGQGLATQAGKHIQISNDNGSTWTGVALSGTTSAQIRDVVMDNSGNLYAAVYSNAMSSLIGNTANGLTSARIRALNVNAAGVYFAATEGTSDDLGRKFHTTGSGGTSLESLTTSSHAIYPNPANEFVNISNLKENSTIFITDISGRTLRTWQINSTNPILPTADLPAGIYTLKIENEGRAATHKLCITH